MPDNCEEWVTKNREYLIKQSEMLQSVITRMANSSLEVKKIGLTVWAAIVGFGFQYRNSTLFVLAFVTFTLFGILDIYYLFQERRLRDNFNLLSWIIGGSATEGQKLEFRQKMNGNFFKPIPKELYKDFRPNVQHKFPKELLSTLQSWANLPYLITFLITIVLLMTPLSSVSPPLPSVSQ